MKIQFFYRIDTLQIDAVFQGCKTNSAKYKDTTKYQEINVKDPLFPITRNHKVILNADEDIIGTEISPNPQQPVPTPNINQDLIDKLRDAWPTLTAAEKAELLRKVAQRILG